MDLRYRSLLVCFLLVASTFVLLPSSVAYSPSNSLQVRPNSHIGLPPGGNGGGHGGHGGGGFTCPTISGADSSTCSTNWSGYADTSSSGAVTKVTGSWTVPSISCPTSGTTYVAVWVGIDGYASSTVEQTGILGECNNGSPSYSAWYEFYPAAMVTITGVSVKPGDVVTASVTSLGGGQFTTSISDANSGSATNTGTVSSAQQNSAEWIVERPALCIGHHCTLTTLADFTSPVSFSSSSATIGNVASSINTFTDVAITMVASSSGPVLAQPSSLGAGGTSFSVAYG